MKRDLSEHISESDPDAFSSIPCFDMGYIKEKFDIERKIGMGKYGTVYEATIPACDFKNENHDVAPSSTKYAKDANSLGLALKVINTRSWEGRSNFHIFKNCKNLLKAFSINQKLKVVSPTSKVDESRALKELDCLICFKECAFIVELEAFGKKFCRHKNMFKLTSTPIMKELWMFTKLYSSETALSLQMRARSKPNLEFTNVKIVIASILLATKFLHERNYSHRDIKLQNILLSYDNNKNVKKAVLCDFGGCSKNTHQEIPLWRGTFSYLAPEYLNLCETMLPFKKYVDHRYKALDDFDRTSPLLDPLLNGKSDIWAIGLVSLGLLLGYSPFSRASNFNISKILLHLFKSSIPNLMDEKMIFIDPIHKLMEVYFDGIINKQKTIEDSPISLTGSLTYFNQVRDSRSRKFPGFLPFCRHCLFLKPEERMKAADLVKLKFIKLEVSVLERLSVK